MAERLTAERAAAQQRIAKVRFQNGPKAGKLYTNAQALKSRQFGPGPTPNVGKTNPLQERPRR